MLQNHPFQDHLERHGVAASPAGLEKFAVAFPFLTEILDGMRIVFTVETGRKFSERLAFSILPIMP
jgi:hypothetical protein